MHNTNCGVKIYKGCHLPVNTIRDIDEGHDCPFPEFFKSDHEENVFFLKKKIDEIKEAYLVRTFGIYKSYKFQVFDKKTDIIHLVQIGTHDENAFKNLKLYGNKDWGFTDIHKSELEKIWEERVSAYNLPIPLGIKATEEIRIS